MLANYMPNSMARRRVRLTLRRPERPVALRSEYITDTKTALILKPRGDAHSATAYKVIDYDGVTHFTASGQKSSDRPCREFRDASGLPLFELHRKLSLRNNTWAVTLPGSDTTSIATGTLRVSLGVNSMLNYFDITFENAAAVGTKEEEDKTLTLRVERHGNVLATFDVVDGDRKIAEIRESIPHNRKLALLPESKKGYRPVLDVTITAGVDTSLVAMIGVIASDWSFSANYL